MKMDGIFLSYWPDLNRRAIVYPKNAFIFGDPILLISSPRRFNYKNKATDLHRLLYFGATGRT